MSTLSIILIIGIVTLAVCSLIALVHAIKHAEEGYEDSTGYHRLVTSPEIKQATTSTLDTGNPWDQVEGSACPWDFKPTLRPAGHNHFAPHQS